MSLTCSRPGCGKQFTEGDESLSCSYHSGGPVFHEGLKSWSCCKELPGHRPVLDFEEFQKIPGCTAGRHTAAKAKVAPPVASPSASSSSTTLSTKAPTLVKSNNGKETYSNTKEKAPPTTVTRTVAQTPPPPPAPVVEDEDDTSVSVNPGQKCLRNGCNAVFISDEASRGDSGPDSICTYHPKGPLFWEGSKGWMCCKPKVLEFEEFLKIKGCKTGKHVFVKKAQPDAPAEELVTARVDHYQTPSEVRVSVFAKQVNQAASSVIFTESAVELDLVLPASKRCKQSIELFGSIRPEESSFKYFGTKVELILVKSDGRSWSMLEKPKVPLPEGFGYTFSAGGRTGTIGGKDLVLDHNNMAARTD